MPLALLWIVGAAAGAWLFREAGTAAEKTARAGGTLLLAGGVGYLVWNGSRR